MLLGFAAAQFLVQQDKEAALDLSVSPCLSLWPQEQLLHCSGENCPLHFSRTLQGSMGNRGSAHPSPTILWGKIQTFLFPLGSSGSPVHKRDVGDFNILLPPPRDPQEPNEAVTGASELRAIRRSFYDEAAYTQFNLSLKSNNSDVTNTAHGPIDFYHFKLVVWDFPIFCHYCSFHFQFTW